MTKIITAIISSGIIIFTVMTFSAVVYAAVWNLIFATLFNVPTITLGIGYALSIVYVIIHSISQFITKKLEKH